MSEENVPSGSDPSRKKPDSYYGSETFAVSRTRFYHLRSRIYNALLVFVVVVGLPIVSVPGLRQRLGGRTMAIRQAMYGPVPKLTVVKVGENKEPFPEEYTTPSDAEILLQKPAPIQLILPPPTQTAPLVSKKAIQAGMEHAAAEEAAEASGSPFDIEADQQQEESGPKFQQGSIEKEAYDLLLTENMSVSDMVSGKNPELQFMSWSAAKRQDEGVYLVDLMFTRLPENLEEHFIWQVNLATKQITPMSFNARSLPK